MVNDIGIIMFENSNQLSNFSLYPNIANVDGLDMKKCNGYILGYPGDKKDDGIYGMKGEVILKHPDKDLIFYKIDTAEGQSGSMILIDNNGTMNIIGVHTNGDDIQRINFGTRIDKNKKDWIHDVINKTRISKTINSDNVNQKYWGKKYSIR
mmetsp:Transcript_10688/g.13300  ORF Transcript_10688/g.13300 Transcript_10688/m.13300 type:complete len:152 (+) Transcript_10688:354-809(+)